MKRIYLTQTERDLLLSKLEVEQIEYLIEFLKRGKKTAFASVLAQQKGGYSEQESIHISTQWILLDFIDAGFVTDQLKCECGRSLRYQYVVNNLATKQVLKFGKTHFQEHTGIPTEIVKEVIEGMTKIDYELDEILIKIKRNWSLEDEGIKLPLDFEIPQDIKEQLDIKLPLLERQIDRLLIAIAQKPMKKEILQIDDLEMIGDDESNQIALFETSITKEMEFYSDAVNKKNLHEFLTTEEKNYIDDFLKKNVGFLQKNI